MLSVETPDPTMSPGVSFHRFPANPEKRAVWLRVFQMDENNLRPYSRACSRHFPAGDAKKDPEIHLGERFVSPVKKTIPVLKEQRAENQ